MVERQLSGKAGARATGGAKGAPTMIEIESRKSGESAKDYLDRYIKWIRDHGEEVLANYKKGALKSQVSTEMYFLHLSTELIQREFSELSNIFDDRLHGDEAALAYEKLLMLVASANSIGHFAMFSISALPRYQRLQAHLGRKARVPAVAANKRKLAEAIIAESGNVPMIATDKFSGSIRDGVRNRLGIESGSWPSARAISRAIDDILKECEESCRQS